MSAAGAPPPGAFGGVPVGGVPGGLVAPPAASTAASAASKAASAASKAASAASKAASAASTAGATAASKVASAASTAASTTASTSRKKTTKKSKPSVSFKPGTKGNSSQQSSNRLTLSGLMKKITNEQDTKNKEGKSNKETQKWINEIHEDSHNILKYNRANEIFPLEPEKRKEILDDNSIIDNNAEMESPIKLLETIKEAVNNKDQDRLNEIINEYETVFDSYNELIKHNKLSITLNAN